MSTAQQRTRGGFWNRVLGLAAGTDASCGCAAEMLESRSMMSAGPVVFADPPLSAPAGFSVVTATATNVQLKWSAAGVGAAGYRVLRSEMVGDFSEVGRISTATTLTFTDSTVVSNHAYRYEIISSNGDRLSTPSPIVSVVTPLVTPSDFTATIVSSTAIRLNWQGRDDTATGYVIVRSVGGAPWAPVTIVPGVSTSTYTDTSVKSGIVYAYKVQAIGGTRVSALTSSVTIAMPMAAPVQVQAVSSASAITVSWTIGDASVASYSVMRSAAGGAYTTVATLAKTVGTYSDATVTGGVRYAYKIMANGTGVAAGVSAAVEVTATPRTPTQVAATRAASGVTVTWIDSNGPAVDYRVTRSTDGSTFTDCGTVASGAGKSFIDSTADATSGYWYRVQAVVGTDMVSAVSVAAPVSAPGAVDTTVSVSTRYGNEMVVTMTGGTASIGVTAAGATLTVTASGRVIAQVAMPSALFIYDRGGTHAVAIDGTVSIRTTITSVGGGTTSITSSQSNVSAWIDTTDTFNGQGAAHRIATLAGNVAKTTGTALANPTDAGRTMKTTGSLWGTGPVVSDANQGAIGDCYFVSSLAAFASIKPSTLAESAVDMGDGTYIVQFIRAGAPVFVRVSNDISTSTGTTYRFARPGTSGSVWAPIMEKAFAYFRSGVNTYASISGGWMGEVYTALGVASSTFWMSGMTESTLFSTVSSALSSGKPVTFGTTATPPNLVGSHAYTLISATRDSNGIARYMVRNPWGVSGTSIESSTGYATLTFEQMMSNFSAGARAA
jgi:Calpain family cysteine protease